jgi:hypothetical protein
MLEELPHRQERLLDPGRGRADAEQPREPLRNECRLRLALEEPRKLRRGFLGPIAPADPRRVTYHGDDRPEGDPLSIRDASAGDHRRAVPEPGKELAGQARLPDTGNAHHRHQLPSAARDRPFEGALEYRDLPLPPDERGVEPSRPPGSPRDHVEEPECPHGLGLPLQSEAARTFGDDGCLDEAVRRFADQDLARFCRLLEAGGRVDGVAGHERMTLRRIGGDYLAGVDAGARLKLDAPCALELLVQVMQHLSHLDGGAHGTQGVVFVDAWHAENRHDGIADELLDDASVALDHRPNLREVPRHDLADRFGVERRGEPRRLHDVGEDDRDDLAGFGRGCRPRAEGRAAGLAETGGARVLGATGGAERAGPHVLPQNVRPCGADPSDPSGPA